MSAAKVAMAPCPSWCTLDPNHDADDVAKGADGRFHHSESFGDQYLTWDDNPSRPERVWWFEPFACELWGSTRAELALEMRQYASEILELADWLTTQDS